MRLALPLALAASLHAFAQTSSSPDFAVDAGLVLVSVTALDRNGALVNNLRLEDFVLEDDGKPRVIENMWRENSTPLTIGLIADTSGSQFKVIPQHQHTLSQFLAQILRPRDQAFLISTPRNVQMIVDTTHSVTDLQDGVNKLDHRKEKSPQFGEPCPDRNIENQRVPCNSPLWNAVYDAANLRMKQVEGRKALIFLTDGLDAGSQHALTDAIEAAQRANSPVYTIPTGGFIASVKHGNSFLSKLARETGGRAYGTTNEAGFKKIFNEIETELRNTYILAFSLPQDTRDGKFHKLKVTTRRRGVTIRTRTGYFADKE